MPYSVCQRYKMGVCAMLICVQKYIVVAFRLSFPDWSVFSIKWRKVDLFSVLFWFYCFGACGQKTSDIFKAYFLKCLRC